MTASSMSERFHDWLDECPVQWTRQTDNGEGTSQYNFMESGEEE